MSALAALMLCSQVVAFAAGETPADPADVPAAQPAEPGRSAEPSFDASAAAWHALLGGGGAAVGGVVAGVVAIGGTLAFGGPAEAPEIMFFAALLLSPGLPAVGAMVGSLFSRGLADATRVGVATGAAGSIGMIAALVTFVAWRPAVGSRSPGSALLPTMVLALSPAVVGTVAAALSSAVLEE
jgi:hypothetical protein